MKTADNTPSEALPPFQPEKHEISVHELKQKLDQGDSIQLIDVREPMEHQIVCLEEAQLIPMNNIPQHIEQLDPSREIILALPSRDAEYASCILPIPKRFPKREKFNRRNRSVGN